MGFMNDSTKALKDMQRWSKKLGLNKIPKNIKNGLQHKWQQRKNKKKQKASTYEELCKWLRNELKK